MPLPHLLGLILVVLVAAGVTIWAATGLGVSLVALSALALLGAVALRSLA